MQTRPTRRRLSARQVLQYLIYALFLGAMLVGALNDPNPIWWWLALVIGTGVIVYAELRDPTGTRPPTARTVLARTTISSPGEVGATARSSSSPSSSSREG